MGLGAWRHDFINAILTTMELVIHWKHGWVLARSAPSCDSPSAGKGFTVWGTSSFFTGILVCQGNLSNNDADTMQLGEGAEEQSAVQCAWGGHVPVTVVEGWAPPAAAPTSCYRREMLCTLGLLCG